MKNLIKFLRTFIIVFIIAIIYLAYKDGVLLDLKKALSVNETFNSNVEDSENNENTKDNIPTIIIEDEKVYLNGDLIENVSEISIKLKEMGDSRKVILKSSKAKLVTYNDVLEYLRDNQYVIIEEH